MLMYSIVEWRTPKNYLTVHSFKNSSTSKELLLFIFAKISQSKPDTQFELREAFQKK